MNPARILWRCLALLGVSASVALSQAADIEVDLASGDRVLGAIKAGGRHSFLLKGLNRLCYSYDVSIKTVRVEFNAKAGEKILGQVQLGGAGTEGLPRNPWDTLQSQNMQPGSATPGRDDLIAVAQAALREAELELSQASAIVEQLESKARCEEPAKAMALQRFWKDSSAALRERLSYARAMLTSAHRSIGAVRALGSNGQTPLMLDTLEHRADSLHVVALDVSRSYVRIGAELSGDGSDTPLRQDFVTDGEDERVDIAITRVNNITNEKEEVAFSVPTERRFRVRFSTGIVATGVDSWHYDRIIREAPAEVGDDADDEPSDSTYSTWARVAGGKVDLLSPAFLVSISVFRSAVDLNLSAGTTLRTVNGGSASLEPLLGLGVGVLDRLFLHAGVHLGREEVLLLARDNELEHDVRLRPVPTSLTRSDAVGVRWRARPFVGFSLRVN